TAAEVQGIGAGMLQVTIELDPVRVLGGQLRKGDSVAVTVSFSDPETTHMILHKIKVTDVRTSDGIAVGTPANGPAPTASLLVTLALDAPAVEKVVFGAEHGRLWLAWEPAEANESGTKVQTKTGVNL
ncbi:MAG: RcpC/CpaB family pilus assembly protein, partial [Acidimicrobiales bacterium]|nr:RcpC/CpaB family pilus assembly protein [Acidimicrobiales bacterium]